MLIWLFCLIKPVKLTKKLVQVKLETVVEQLLVYRDGKNQFETNHSILKGTIVFCSTSKRINISLCINVCRQKQRSFYFYSSLQFMWCIV